MAKRPGKGEDGSPKRDRGAARRARAAARAVGGATGPVSGPRTPSQDAANAWRQGVSEATAQTVDELAAHAQAVVLEQLQRFGTFPTFLVTARRDGEYELDSVERAETAPPETAPPETDSPVTDPAGASEGTSSEGTSSEGSSPEGDDELHRGEDPVATLRVLAQTRADELLGAALAVPATLPDRSGAPALVIELEHRDGVSLTLVQAYRVAGRDGARSTELDDPVVEKRPASLLRRQRDAEDAPRGAGSGD